MVIRYCGDKSCPWAMTVVFSFDIQVSIPISSYVSQGFEKHLANVSRCCHCYSLFLCLVWDYADYCLPGSTTQGG